MRFTEMYSLLMESRMSNDAVWIVDGDIMELDNSHDEAVITHVLEEVADILRLDLELVFPDGGYLFFQDLDAEDVAGKMVDAELIQDKRQYTDDPKGCVESLLAKAKIEPAKANAMARMVFDDKIDAREYGIDFLGWKRVRWNNVQTRTLTTQDMREIVETMEKLLDRDDDPTVNIEIKGQHKLYADVPLSVLRSGRPDALYEYARRY